MILEMFEVVMGIIVQVYESDWINYYLCGFFIDVY